MAEMGVSVASGVADGVAEGSTVADGVAAGSGFPPPHPARTVTVAAAMSARVHMSAEPRPGHFLG
jgi:hypothetical protein